MPQTESRNSASRKMSRINPTLDKNLSSYALVAGVTGAGVLALALPAEGKVVFTATHQLLGPYMRVYLDLNNDGFDDFFFYNFNFATHISYPGSYGSVEVTGLHAANDVIVTSGPKFFAEAFGSGVEVSSKANFRSGQNLMNFCRTNPIHHTRFRSGPWINVKDRFLGLEFTVQGQIHYGWARFSMRQQKNYCETFAVLTGYAYETVPNQPITTGKPSDNAEVKVPARTPPDNESTIPFEATLASLALGARGLTIWRRDEYLAKN